MDFFPATPDQKPVAIAQAALDYARTHYYDVMIVDTAGRLAIDEAMMAEIRELHAALAPVETLFVVDAMQGQDAVNVAKAFGEALPLTGVILTKLDGDARGGAALSVRQSPASRSSSSAWARSSPTWSRSIPSAWPRASSAWATCCSLVEEARRSVDLEEAEKLAQEGQERQGLRPRGLQGADAADEQDGRLERAHGQAACAARRSWRRAPRWTRRWSAARIGIINSMTPQERAKPEVLKASRKRRIAAGAGVPVQEVNRLLNAVRADAEDDEDDEQGRHAEDDAQHARHAAGDALGLAAWTAA